MATGDLPFDVPSGELDAEQFARIAEAVARRPLLRGGARRQGRDPARAPAPGERPTGRAVPAGGTLRFDDTFVHRMRREPGAGITVTIHACSPPLAHTGQYAEHDDGLLHRTPTSSEEQLVPHGHQGTPTDL